MRKKEKCFSENSISKEQAEDLRLPVLNDGQYIGSSVFEYMFGQYDNQLYHLLFDGHSNNLYETEGQRPPIIIGRRGSGKSTYLNYLAQKKNVEPIEIKVWDIIDTIESQVTEIFGNQTSVDSEKVADIWHFSLLVLACVKILNLNITSPAVKKFLGGFPISSIAGSTVTQITSLVIEKIKDAYLKSPGMFNAEVCISAITSSSTTLDDLERAISDAFLSANVIAVFMLDNPEQLAREEVDELSQRSQDIPRTKTISGLLNLAGRFNQGNIGLQLRICIPSEQFYYLKKASSNSRKDFKVSQLLHWSGGEILSMLAHRLMVFLTVYPRYRTEEKFDLLSTLPIYTRKGAIEFWSTVFEGEIVNGRKTKEKPIVYLLRHSQLVPRQLIDYINKSIDKTLHSGHEDLTNIPSNILRDSIQEIEYDIASEVINAYSYSYPEATEVFDIVRPKLPMITTGKEVKDVLFKTTDAKAVLSRYQSHPQVSATKDRFLRLLIETGMYGKVSHSPREESEGYVEAEYEYTMAGTLGVDDNDKLALHPLFSGGMSKQHYSMLDDGVLGVHPIGTGFEVL